MSRPAETAMIYIIVHAPDAYEPELPVGYALTEAQAFDWIASQPEEEQHEYDVIELKQIEQVNNWRAS